MLLALLEAGSQTLDQSITIPDNPDNLTEGDVLITNNKYEDGVTLYMKLEGDTLTACILLHTADASGTILMPGDEISVKDLSGS